MIRQILQLGMKIYFPLLLVLLLAGCSSDDPINKDPEDQWEDPLEGLPDKGQIRFDNPEIGQRSRYVFFNAIQDMVTKKVTFTYDPDTLVLGITAKESDKWVIREFFSKGSKNMVMPDNREVINYLLIDSDSAYFTCPPNGDFFSWVFSGKKLAIPLPLVADPAPLNPDCLPLFDYDTNIWTQYSIDYTQHGKTFHHLNEFFDYTEMSGDGLGLMYAYGPPYGLVRWTWVSAWDQNEAEGFDLVSE